jgi:hypothetical protein
MSGWLRRVRGEAGKAGRKPKLTTQQVCHARKLLAHPETTINDVAANLKVNRATFYRRSGSVRPEGSQPLGKSIAVAGMCPAATEFRNHHRSSNFVERSFDRSRISMIFAIG